MQKKVPDRGLCDGKPENRAVRQSLGCVELSLEKGGGIAAALAVTFAQRVADLLALQVVFHDGRIGFIIIDDGPVRRDPCDPEICRA